MFEGLKEIYEEEKNTWGGANNWFHTGIFMSKDDLETLKAWLDKTAVPFKGFNGRIYFPKTVKFPRYKFSEYSLQQGKTVRKVRDISNADACIADLEEMKRTVESCLSSTKRYIVRNNSHENTGLPCYMESSALKSFPGLTERTYSSAAATLRILSDLYMNFLKHNFKLISVQDLAENLGSRFESVNAEKADQLSKIFESKNADDHRLGMEIMTNCDLKTSHFHVLLLFGKYGRTMKNNSYWNSTSFTAFKESIDRLGLGHESIMHRDSLEIAKRYLQLDNKQLFEEDVESVIKDIREEVENTYSFDQTGFRLKGYEIELDLDPKQIIKNNVQNEQDAKSIKEVIQDALVTVV